MNGLARRLAAVLVAACALAAQALPARADLRKLEGEFKDAIERVETSTVVVVAAGAPPGSLELSGVVITRGGLILTHSEAGRVVTRDTGGKPGSRLDDAVDVRVPDLKKGTFTNYHGRVLARTPDCASALVQVDDAPRIGFKSWLVPATAATLRVGSFTFAMGNAFGHSSESTPSLTAGIVASLAHLAAPSAATGELDAIYTTAAVNPGVNGGPLVDVHGRLVGTIVSWVDARGEPNSPFQFLGRATPVDRLRAAYAGVDAARAAFGSTPPAPLVTPESDALELVIERNAAAAAQVLVSLDIQRKEPVSSVAINEQGRTVELPRYRGPVSGFIASPDGLVVTALYNLTNLATLVAPGLASLLPPAATTKAGIDAIEGATVHLADGTSVPAKLLGVHEGLGVVVFRAELPAGRTLPTLPPAPPDTFAEGRFVLALGDPFGAQRNPDPLTTFGILSKRHADDAPEAWRGHWQTDARGTDGNCGGAVVDLRGRLLGMMALWNPAQHGRSSGIAFVLPWDRIESALPELATGRSFRRPFLGVQWDLGAGAGARILRVVPDSAASSVGIQPGDEIVALDGTPVTSPADCTVVLATKWSGDTLRLKIRRGPDILDLEAQLGTRD